MMNRTRFLLIVAAVLGIALQWARAEEAALKNLDVDLSIIDKAINPCDDFYQYSCGNWLKTAEIPSDRPMWNRSFSTIDLNNQEILNKILKDYAAGKQEPANPYSKLLGNFYQSCMDEKSIETGSLAVFKKQLKAIDDLESMKDFAPLLVTLHKEGVNAFFDFSQTQDAKDSTQVIGEADQAGLGLPDRDYYLKDDAKMTDVRKHYREYIAKMFKLLGDTQAAGYPDTIIRFETALAKISMSRVDRRNPVNVYHRLERAGLLEKTPLFDWNTYFNTLDPNTTAKLQAINVTVPAFFSGLNDLFAHTPIRDLKTYLKWHILTSMTEALPKRFVDEKFHFVSTALSGQKSLEVRWKRCVKLTNATMGFALSRAFVDVAYGQAGKEKSQNMIREIEESFHRVLDSLVWMDATTKKEAARKLGKINNKIGYPAVWRSYDGLHADKKSFLENLQLAEQFNVQYELDKIGKPLDPNEWGMTPSTVNAYYDAQRNEMVFPAGILQYPFFNRQSPDELNFGAMGVVMGHELTHGFDDEGRQYDADGNLKDWWDKNVLQEFDKRTACVADEYSSFEALPGVHVNGKLTLGENIADQGGMKLAYEAWKLKHPSDPAPKAGDPTTEQKFFLAFAQSWCQKEQEQFTRMRVTVDPHSPSRFRVNGVISQFAPFSKVFSCATGTKMAPANRCEVW